ncbi:MAG: hypothetical protein KGL39_55830 [Patescibacteria group bacterium]|nr:hypothetical protein [Patescibacteria group bacterium]
MTVRVKARILSAMDAIEQILALTDRFSAATGLSDATISTRLFNDGKRIGKLRSGGDVGTRHFAATIRWFSDAWPADAPWPADVARPPSRQAAAE